MPALPLQYFFVTGGHKSGTSWVSWMLNSHPEVCCLGAARFLGWTHSAETWINEEQFRTWAEFHTIANSWLKGVEIQEAINRARRAMIESVMQWPLKGGERAVGDKTPMFYCRSIDELHALFPDAVIINVMRDGRDVAVSHHFHMLRREEYQFFPSVEEGQARRRHYIDQQGEALPLLTPKSLRMVISNWREAALGAQRARELYGLQYLELRYEALLAQPERISEAFALLGVADDAAIVADCVAQNAFAVKSGGWKPGEEDGSAFVRKGVAGDWRNYFTEDEKVLFKELAGDLLIELGYERDKHW